MWRRPWRIAGKVNYPSSKPVTRVRSTLPGQPGWTRSARLVAVDLSGHDLASRDDHVDEDPQHEVRDVEDDNGGHGRQQKDGDRHE